MRIKSGLIVANLGGRRSVGDVFGFVFWVKLIWVDQQSIILNIHKCKSAEYQ